MIFDFVATAEVFTPCHRVHQTASVLIHFGDGGGGGGTGRVTTNSLGVLESLERFKDILDSMRSVRNDYDMESSQSSSCQFDDRGIYFL